MIRIRPSCALATRMRRDECGSVLIEFALLAPAVIMLLMGVVQVGLHVQNSNAVRNLAADGARFAVVQAQLDRPTSTDTVETWIRSRGVGSRYNLNTDRLNICVTSSGSTASPGCPSGVAAVTSRVTGVREMKIRITYNAPDYIPFVAGNVLQLDYTRPVFLLQPAPAPSPST